MKGIFKIDFADTLGFVLIYFFFSGMVVWAIFQTPTTQERGAKRLQNWFDSKLKRFDLRTRHLLRVSLFRLGIIMSLGTFLYAFFATYAGESNTFFYDLFIIGIFLILFSPYLMSDKDVALVYFRKFRNDKIKLIQDLSRALNRYNKSVGFRFSTKKLSAIVQYVRHVDSLDLKEDKSNIEARLDVIIQSLQNKQYGEIPQVLANLSTDSNLFIQKYSNLGMEIKSSLWTRTKETFTFSMQKILPQLFWLLILLVVYLILRAFIPTIELPFP